MFFLEPDYCYLFTRKEKEKENENLLLHIVDTRFDLSVSEKSSSRR